MAAQSPLGAAITTTNGTSVTVLDVLGFPSTGAFTIIVDSEWMRVTAGAGTTTWTVTRGYNSTTAATHLISAAVTLVPDAEWTGLGHMMDTLGLTTAAQAAVMLPCVEAANAELSRRIGLFLGPSADALRLYDGHDATRDGTRLWVPGGIRTLTAVRLASSTGGTLTSATAADFLLRPHAHEMRPGSPYSYVQIAEDSSSRFWPGHDNVELTGTFGPAAVDADCARIADMIAARMYQYSESGGDLTLPSASKFVYADDARKLDAIRAEHFAPVR